MDELKAQLKKIYIFRVLSTAISYCFGSLSASIRVLGLELANVTSSSSLRDYIEAVDNHSKPHVVFVNGGTIDSDWQFAREKMRKNLYMVNGMSSIMRRYPTPSSD